MRKAAAFAGIILAAMAMTLSAGCSSGENGGVIIIPENECWSPFMSSSVGIGLSAVYQGDENASYRWTADHGEFLLWTPKVVPCAGCDGCPCESTETVWWSYIPGEGEGQTSAEQPGEIHITVKAIDPDTGTELAESSIVLIKTEDNMYCVEE